MHGTNKRLSDHWEIADRQAALRKFIERSGRALSSPVAGYQDLSDPNGGFEQQLVITSAPKASQGAPSLPSVHFTPPRFSRADYSLSIQETRPLVLRSEDTYVLKAATHMRELIDEMHREKMQKLVDYVSYHLDAHGRLKHPLYYVYVSSRDNEEVSTNNFEIADHYIYGYSIKDDSDKRVLIDQLGGENETTLTALCSYLVQVLRIVNTVKKQLDICTEAGVISLETSDIDDRL